MTNKIKCPKCGQEIDIEDIMQLRTKEAVDKELKTQKVSMEKEKEEAVKDALNKQKNEYEKKQEEFKKAFIKENEDAYKVLEEELNKKTDELKELNKLKAEKSRIEREKLELEEKITAKKEEEFTLKLIEEKQKIQKTSDEKYELQIKELQKKFEDQKILTEEMKKKLEQGSMQLQGEAQELAIEDYLKQNFIYDTIEEIAKGDYGADCLQTVNELQKQNCGTIYYESKRTKTFNESWIQKFKNDIKSKSADIGVLVTAVYPASMDRMGFYKGIYICTYEEFKALSNILRENIVKISEIKQFQDNIHDKSTLLYNFLTSTEFRFQLETIVNSFVEMQKDLEAEKRAMNRLWKKREKEILNVISATSDMYGSIQGIAGNAIKPVKELEMPLLDVDD